MRFIGNKVNLLEMIYQAISVRNIKGNSVFDLFSGTKNVAKFFKKLNYLVYSSDLLFFSYILQRAYIENNQDLTFEKLLKVIDIKNYSMFASPLYIVVEYLNNLEPLEGFIYHNYTPEGTNNSEYQRMYYTGENGRIIDTIRQKIECWKKEDLITENEYYVLLACLIETVPFYANVSGVYAAFQKKWDPRALKKMKLRPIKK